MHLLALTKYDATAASTRQRFFQFREHLAAEGITFDCAPLLDGAYLAAKFAGGEASPRALLAAYLGRLQLLPSAQSYGALWVQYELFPWLPGFMESLVFRPRVPVICDFDDAIFHQYDLHPNWLVRKLLGRKLEPLLRGADLAICGNAYLEAYAARFCRRTAIVPTVVDTAEFKPGPPREARPRPVIGWIGSPSTFAYVRPLAPLLSGLAEELDLGIRIVGAGPQAAIPPRFAFLEWSQADEVAQIQAMDIGIMPLPDKPWARGKCGYKLIQYMACGLPVIASPVGVNADIVEHGFNGFLATTPGEWADAIRTLAADPALRARMGAAGRTRIERDYSLAVHGPRLARMIREVVDVPKR